MSQNQASITDYKLPGMRGGNKRGERTVEKPQNGWKTLKKLVNYFTKEKGRLLILLIAVSISAVCTVYVPKLQSEAIDSIADGAFEALTGILAIMLAVYLVNSAFTFVQSRMSAILSQSIVSRMRKDLFARIVNLPICYLDSHPHGDIMSRMTNDIENISNTVSQSLSSLVSGILTMLGTIVMMVYLCPRLALLSCTTVILTLGATKYLSGVMRRFYTKRQIILGELNSTVEEMVGGYHTVAAYDRQPEVIEQFNQSSDELTRVGIIAEILGGSMGPVMNVINNIGFVIIAAFGGYFALKGIISIGVISAFIVYAKQFGRPLDELAQIYGQIQTAIAGAERVFAIMDEPCEDKTGERDMEGLEGNISFRNVNFSYVKGKQVLKDFDFDVRAGHKIALVGSTGSGKTTVVNLLMRFYDIDSGAIEIDGVNIKDIDCRKLRRDIAIVLQDTVLFSDSIKNNLKYSNENAADGEMEEAARISHCHQMIMNLPEGYDTHLTQAGFNLSQGQRQLLAIARAFIAKPKILILDEATSSVDTRTEKDIQDAMVKLMENRTSLIIAHRLSTIQDADCIVVLDNGNIVETGNHEELLAQKGRYYELYMTQFEGNAT
ncbi:MAG: ABC transporter ATP-binding protein/permease [Roseburia sp.]|nr:ABC transporter ATP-binding protein/permease [Roseburia sp.]